MRILLDTHVLLWWFANDPNLSSEARGYIANSQNIIFVSAVSSWEIFIKKTLGKLDAPDDLESAITVNRFEPLPITIKHTAGINGLPLIHTDPFDRLLISQANLEGLTLITNDKRLSQYNIPIIWA